MAAPKKSKTSKVLHDVAKPGETRVDATSRPVIVGHKSTIKQDPMFKEAGDDPEEVLARPAHGKDLEPVSDEPLTVELEESTEVQSVPDAAEEAGEFTLPIGLEEESAPEEESAGKTEPEPKPEPKTELEESPKEKKVTSTPDKKSETIPEKPKEKNQPGEPATGDDTAKDTPSDEVDKTKESVDDKERAEQEARDAEVQKLVNSKEFFVPIGQVSRRRSNYAVIILLILIVIAAAVSINFAVDAELIEIGVEPLTNFL